MKMDNACNSSQLRWLSRRKKGNEEKLTLSKVGQENFNASGSSTEWALKIWAKEEEEDLYTRVRVYLSKYREFEKS